MLNPLNVSTRAKTRWSISVRIISNSKIFRLSNAMKKQNKNDKFQYQPRV